MASIAVMLVLVIVKAEIYLGLRFIPVFMGLCITLVCGVLDDFRTLNSRHKFLIQVMAGLLVLLPGYMFRHLFLF
ncbi:MAG: hypothetical protein LBH57_04830, partial [Treponema sp.]|nr:hypothetical protein [Treponema sp.]